MRSPGGAKKSQLSPKKARGTADRLRRGEIIGDEKVPLRADARRALGARHERNLRAHTSTEDRAGPRGLLLRLPELRIRLGAGVRDRARRRLQRPDGLPLQGQRRTCRLAVDAPGLSGLW